MLTEQQKEVRKKGIGGSESAAILGFSPWRTPMDVWLEKTGREKPDTSDNPYFHWGHRLEKVIAEEYASVTGNTVVYPDKTYVHPQYPWMIGHIDGWVKEGEKVLECKTANAFDSKNWGSGPTDIKLPYIIQVQHYMAITETQAADVAVLIGGNDFRIYTIPRSEKIIEHIIRRCGLFYNQYVLKDIPPHPETFKDAAYVWPTDNGEYREATMEEFVLIQEYKQTQKESTKLKEKLSNLKDQLTISMKDMSGLMWDGMKALSYKATKTGTRRLTVNL